jgi:hypothetical protein
MASIIAEHTLAVGYDVLVIAIAVVTVRWTWRELRRLFARERK